MTERICTVDGCERKHYGRGWCSMHWARMARRGTIGGPEPEKLFGVPLVQRIAVRVRPADNGCIVWTGPRDANGYGRINLADKPSVLVHRAAWIEAHGPIPPETPCVLHRCDNPPCCNLDHLWLGTHADNMADMTSKGRRVLGGRALALPTYCRSGRHRWDEQPLIGGSRRRICRLCRNETRRESWRRAHP